MGLFDFLFGKKNTQTQNTYQEPKQTTVRSVVNTVNQNININNIDDIKKCFIALDLETTGLSDSKDKIIEVGAVKFENGIVTNKYGSLIKIGFHIPDSATRVNHITDSMLNAQGKEPSIVYKELAEFLSDSLKGNVYIVAHNASFDMGFLSKALSEYGYPGTLNYIDTLKISRASLKNLDNHKQQTVAQYFGIVNNAEHRAVSDAETCGAILLNLLDIQKIEIENEQKKQAERIEKSSLNEEEKEIGAIILNILKNNGADISKFRFYKNSANYIDITYVYTLFKYKVTKKGNYIIIPKDKIKSVDLKTEPCTKTEGENSIRIFFDNPFELESISAILMNILKEFIDNGSVYDNFNRYEKDFFANATMSEITDIPGYIEKAKQRIIDNANEKEKIKEQEEDKLRKQEEKEQAKRLKQEQAEQKKIANEVTENEKERIRKELLENAETYTIEMIKDIVALSQAENKRAIIKLDDDNNIFKVYESVSVASEDVGIAPKTIRDVANGRYKHGGGFVWKYADEYIADK